MLHGNLGSPSATPPELETAKGLVSGVAQEVVVEPNTETSKEHASPVSADRSPYKVKEEPLRKPRKTKIIAIASALNFGHEVNEDKFRY
ncbi:hypothetical protein UA08_04849 [Talaromyces atroroseus]|uniref:Uncharacterized protein n=1 Tax=Talaromyces atroroseus TaxID=1441469 RepID=A0A225AFV3_TALAT|nr:hypothetical protein UA08_04849 [Talaromyces atroroseus]OKL60232.1 hypothetical protein UA08_04849 [Talaromyces atroroseus]